MAGDALYLCDGLPFRAISNLVTNRKDCTVHACLCMGWTTLNLFYFLTCSFCSVCSFSTLYIYPSINI